MWAATVDAGTQAEGGFERRALDNCIGAESCYYTRTKYQD